jgi:hypothetical protein
MSSDNKQIPDSDASEDEDLEAEVVHTPGPEEKKDSSPPQSTLSHRFRESPQRPSDDRRREKNSDDSIAVMVPAPARPWEYQPFRGDTTVDIILEVKIMDDKEWYTIEYENGKRELVSILSYYVPAEVLPVCFRSYEDSDPLVLSPIGGFQKVNSCDTADKDLKSDTIYLLRHEGTWMTMLVSREASGTFQNTSSQMHTFVDAMVEQHG